MTIDWLTAFIDRARDGVTDPTRHSVLWSAPAGLCATIHRSTQGDTECIPSSSPSRTRPC